MNMNTRDFNDEFNDDDAAEAKRALRHLAARANTEPTRPLNTYQPQDAHQPRAGRQGRFEWRRLAVAAAIVALVGGGIAVLNQRSGDSDIAAPTVDAIPAGAGQQVDGAGPQQGGGVAGQSGVAANPSLATGFGLAPNAFEGDARRYLQRQYAENADRPETGRFLTVTDVPFIANEPFFYNYDDFYLSPEPGASYLAPQTTQPSATTTPWVSGTVGPDEASGAGSGPAMECVIAARPDVTVAPDVSLAAGVDGKPCQWLTMTEVDGEGVAIFASDLSDEEVQAVISNLVPAPDGSGHVVAPDALPEGLSEIAVGSITNMFEPRPAIAEPQRVELVWTYQSPLGNPVLDEAGLAQAEIVAIADGDTGLAGQRLLFAEVRDATVGDDPAVVQIAPSGSVRVVWRHEGTLFMYEEEMANADDTVRRANELLPFFLNELVDGQYEPQTPQPTTTVPECGAWSATVPADIATSVSPCDWATSTYPDLSVPDTTLVIIGPDTTDVETTTTTTWPETTTTSTTYPGRDDWSTTTYPGQGDSGWPTTTTYPGQGDGGDGPTPTTYPGPEGGVAPDPPVTVPPPPMPS